LFRALLAFHSFEQVRVFPSVKRPYASTTGFSEEFCNEAENGKKMGNKLFVGGLSWNTDDNSLKAAFEAHGTVEEAKVIVDRETGRSRGFGFVTMSQESEAADAMASLDGKELDGRTVKVNEAQERQRRDGGGGRRGGGGNARW
jgi:RNA recognition motif-containing protein